MSFIKNKIIKIANKGLKEIGKFTLKIIERSVKNLGKGKKLDLTKYKDK